MWIRSGDACLDLRCRHRTAAAATARTAEYHNQDVDDSGDEFARQTSDIGAATHGKTATMERTL